MSFRDKAEQHTYKHICVALGKSPMETKQLIKRHIVVAVFPKHLSIDDTYMVYGRWYIPLS